MANHLLNVCHSSTSRFVYLHLQLIEKVSVQNDDDIDKVLLERKILASAIIYVKPQIK